MFCSTTYHCKSHKLPKFKRRQQRLKFFNYCRKKCAADFWKELRRIERQKVRLKKASKSKKFSKGERHE